MKQTLLIIFMLPLAIGCGSEPESDHRQLESMITVIDHNGEETQMPSSSLIDPDTGEPTVQKVLVIDRQAKKRGFVDAKELQSQNPSSPRYFPVTTELSSEG
ncbi:MAG: hypothetical protein HUJ26_12775 [Planctomycetaceae bacterium]|nr:hypothetical protein [Planctomycetaceae bacterium]